MSLCKTLRNCFFIGHKKGGGDAHLIFFLSFACLFLVFVQGESLVPEQANEVEESKRRAARSCGSRKGTGECEKRNPPPVRALGHRRGHPPADRGLSSQWRQPRQWPQLGARTLMIHAVRTSSILRKEVLWRQALLKHRLHREMTMTVIFLILLHAGISSQFLTISRGFNTKCHVLKMLPRWRWRRWTRFEYIPDVWVVCMAASRYVCFCLHWKWNCYQEQTMRHFHSTCLQNEDAEDELASNIPDAWGDVCDSRQVSAFACTDN